MLSDLLDTAERLALLSLALFFFFLEFLGPRLEHFLGLRVAELAVVGHFGPEEKAHNGSLSVLRLGLDTAVQL